mmetsp:Transcript_9588/g.14068  ORF Transcript_9588/g.14068 Transcript_9588/m.14068 type:complete len:212 (+) Transcript_9588:1683-2318(+)
MGQHSPSGVSRTWFGAHSGRTHETALQSSPQRSQHSNGGAKRVSPCSQSPGRMSSHSTSEQSHCGQHSPSGTNVGSHGSGPKHRTVAQSSSGAIPHVGQHSPGGVTIASPGPQFGRAPHSTPSQSNSPMQLTGQQSFSTGMGVSPASHGGMKQSTREQSTTSSGGHCSQHSPGRVIPFSQKTAGQSISVQLHCKQHSFSGTKDGPPPQSGT